MNDRQHMQIFEEARPRLLGLAYRILGSRADAEDAVQDTFLKWQEVDRASIDTPAGWLTTACTRRCLDLLKAAHRKRVDYVGAWLPEPIHTASDDNAEEKLALTSSLTTAFLLMLERLTPKERAAYLLHEIFGQPYDEVAETLDMQETAARKLVSRAKTNIGLEKARHQTPRERQDELLSAFHSAIHGGNVTGLSALLSADVKLTADGGGKVATVLGVDTGVAAGPASARTDTVYSVLLPSTFSLTVTFLPATTVVVFSVAASCSFSWATLTASVSFTPLATLLMALLPASMPSAVMLTSPAFRPSLPSATLSPTLTSSARTSPFSRI